MLKNVKSESLCVKDIRTLKFPFDGFPVRCIPITSLVSESHALLIDELVKGYREKLDLIISTMSETQKRLITDGNLTAEEREAVYCHGKNINTVRNDRIKAIIEQAEELGENIINKFNEDINDIWEQDLNESLHAVHAYDSASVMGPSIFWLYVDGKFGCINDQLIIVDYSNIDANQFKDPKSKLSKILKRVNNEGFWSDGYHYVRFGASASHTRVKKVYYIRKDIYEQFKDKLLAGLHDYAENGMIVNGSAISGPGKWENYKMLIMSTIIQRYDIDWEKVLLVEEFKTVVPSQKVIFIDVHDDNYNWKKDVQDIEIKPDDGCFFLNAAMGFKPGTYRGFYFKGFGLPIYFNNWIGKSVKCADGKFRVIQEDTPAIINTSVLKMHKAYSESMKEYAKHVPSCIWACKPERDEDLEDHVFNYQMLQTILNTDEDDVQAVVDLNAQQIKALKQDVGARRKFLCGNQKTNFQKICAAYPPMRGTAMASDQIERKIDGLINNAYKGKYSITEAYHYLMNDPIYIMNHYVGEDDAAIPANHFVCRGYAEGELCDILRAPHMWPGEHCWRTAMADDTLADVVPACNVIFMSCLDINTIILNNDVDGDIALVLHENNPICKAAYNGKHLLPLVYKIEEAPKFECNDENTFDFYRRAYEQQKGVGGYSNAVTKILNNQSIPLKERLLCAAIGVQAGNNEIDSAKTQKHYEPTGAHAKEFNKCERASKFPWFMTIAKGKNPDKCSEKPVKFDPNASFINNCIVKFDESIKRVYRNIEQSGEFNCEILMNSEVELLDWDTGKDFMRMYHWLRNISSKEPKFWIDAPAPELFGQFKLTGYDVMNEDVESQRQLALEAFTKIRKESGISLDEQVNYMVHKLMSDGCNANCGLLFILYGDVILKNIEANYDNEQCVGDGYIWDATENKLWKSGKALGRELGIAHKMSDYYGMTSDGKKREANGHVIYNLKHFKGIINADELAAPTRELAEKLNAILMAESN